MLNKVTGITASFALGLLLKSMGYGIDTLQYWVVMVLVLVIAGSMHLFITEEMIHE